VDDLTITLGQMLPQMQKEIMQDTKYFGVPTYKNPLDAWVYQEIIFEMQPDVIVEIGNKFGGSALMMAHWLDQIGHGRIIGVDLNHSRVPAIVRDHPRISFIDGDGCESFEAVKRKIDPGEWVVVIEDSSHTYENTLNVLRRYSGLVSLGSYFIVEDGIMNHGLKRQMKRGPYEAIETFLAENPNFISDRARERVVTWNPKGYLKRLEKRHG
jgi:cephalosporin hydroxylase